MVCIWLSAALIAADCRLAVEVGVVVTVVTAVGVGVTVVTAAGVATAVATATGWGGIPC